MGLGLHINANKINSILVHVHQLKVETGNRVLVCRCQATFQGEIGITEARKCGEVYLWSTVTLL